MKAAATSRLFLALWPDEATRSALAQCRDAWAWDAHASPEPTERLHLTLHFLGAVPQPRLPELIDGLRVPFSRFTLQLDRAGRRQMRWPNGIAVLTPKAVPQALLALHAALRVELERLDLAVETRGWRPHVTLARHASGSAAPAAQTSPVNWQVRGYALVESQSLTGGYVVLREHR